MKILVTGASGVLGSAVYQAFKTHGHNVTGLANSRPSEGLTKLNLLDEAETAAFFKNWKKDSNEPAWVIHCAAERRPDAFTNDANSIATKLNVEVPRNLASFSSSLGFTLIYISTDYVFDGLKDNKERTPSGYPTSAKTNPLQAYGVSKRDGEDKVLAARDNEGAKATVLRVPVLYGPAPENSDTAVNVLMDYVIDKKSREMDDYAARYPTNVVDIARFLVRLSASEKDLPRIIHCSAKERFTKYQMCGVFARILRQVPGSENVSVEHLNPISAAPTDGVARPYDSQLDIEENKDLVGEFKCSSFEKWCTRHLDHSKKIFVSRPGDYPDV
ncbi:NAD(P)-binding protein [Coniophora puteana RWD-64-598 SS2]|uniref:NAD(P)-binding protein n=1 Tax=Coniophora puteana (strain RWD-64-598) TaxID=741705 RepID=A0A5M3MI82_CONPW|nr:NAD(P)-binding protein [Coniophora puteana RWD-64-598 SS2]EIW78494.1 NAD(P)-binding protein [Coniophora puteana RWD-64-598 SS2]